MKQAMTKRFICLLLSFIMTLGILPIGVMAEELAQPESISVDFTMSVEGELQLSKNGTDGLVRIPIEVPVGSTPADAIKMAHKEHYDTGEEGYSFNEEYSCFSKLWGQTTMNIGYFVDGVMVSDPSMELTQGDNLEATIYKNYLSDVYTRFEEQEQTVHAKQALEVTLLSNVISNDNWTAGMMAGEIADKPLSDATILTDDGLACNIPWDDSEGWTTDENGEVIISFDDEGTYYVSASKENETLVPAICIITVLEEESQEDKTAAVTSDKDTLTFAVMQGENTSTTAVKTNLTFPQIGQSDKTKIKWASSNPAVIDTEGNVFRPTHGNGDESVKLTATISYGEVSEQEEFNLTVLAISAEEVLQDIYDNLPSKLAPMEWDGDVKKDTNIIKMLQTLVKEVHPSADVENVCVPSAEQTQIASDGSITYGVESVSNKDVTFTLKLADKTYQYTVPVTVNAKASTKEEAFAADWLVFDEIREINESIAAVKTDLLLPKEDSEGYYTEIEWTSNNTDVIEIASYSVNGKYPAKVRRPHLGEEAATVILTAKIQKGIYWDYGMAPAGPMPDPAYGIKTFEITVPSVTQLELDEAQTLVDASIALYDLNDIVTIGLNDPADLQALTYNIKNIPYNWNYVDDKAEFENEYRLIDVTWSSTNPGISDVSSTAKVTRTGTEQSGDIVLTLSYNGATAEKRFPAKVLAFTASDAETENAVLQEVSDALTFEVIRNENMMDSEVVTKLTKPVAAIKDGDSVSFTSSNKYHHLGANIAWTSGDANVITDDLTIIRPNEDIAVTLTATISSPRFDYCDGVNEIQKQISVMVLAKDTIPLLDNMASYYAAKDAEWWGAEFGADWWHAVGMTAYEEYTGQTKPVISPEAKQEFANKTIDSVVKGADQVNAKANILANAINGMSAFGFDATQLWTVNRTIENAVDKLNQIEIEEATEGWYLTFAPYVLAALNQVEYDTEAQEQAHVAYLLKNLNGSQSFIDSYAMVLQGLIYYYDLPDVKIAVDKAIEDLSNLQNEYGTFGNANADAMVIIALAQMGIDANTDTRFIKNGNSLLDGLLSYKASTNDGFIGYQTDKRDEYASKQAFLALIAAYEVMNTHAPYNIYDFTTVAKEPVYSVGLGNTQTTNPPSSDSDVKVKMSLNANGQTWIRGTWTTVKEGQTVYDVFEQILDDSGFTYESNGGYISSITTDDGMTLSHFDHGENSGWLYKVNGELPNVSSAEYLVSSYDSIQWYYTDDWTQDDQAGKYKSHDNVVSDEVAINSSGQVSTIKPEADVANGKAKIVVNKSEATLILEEMKTSGASELLIAPQIDESVNEAECKLPKSILDSLVQDEQAKLTVKTPVASIDVSKKVLSGISKLSGDTVKFSATKLDVDKLSEENKDLVGKHPIFDFSINVGQQKVTEFDGAVKITIPYVPMTDEDIQNLTIFYIDKEGKATQMLGAYYDASAGGVVFETTHFSSFAVVYDENKMRFTDVAETDWFSDAVKVTYEENLFNGTSEQTFSPNAQMSRAMFFTVLYRMDGNTNEQTTEIWYIPSLEWVTKEGISDGSKPEASITREQFVTILYRYAGMKGYDLTSNESLSSYVDRDSVSDWAKDAVKWAVDKGIINGRTNDTIVPNGITTRAEVAVMIQRFLEWMQ